jgi:hypothetical protein
MTSRQQPLGDLDAALRHALQPRARQAPMPDELFEVPRAWVHPRRSPALIGRGLALAATAATAMLLVTLILTRIAPAPSSGNPVDDRTAALGAFGIDPELAVETADGLLALRVEVDGTARIRLGLITGSRGEYRWRDLAVAEGSTDAVADSYAYVFPISCDPAAGLTQPDIVFGYFRVADGHELITIRPKAGLDAVRGRWSIASGNWHAGLLLYAMQPGAGPRPEGLDLLIVESYPVQRPDSGVVLTVTDPQEVTVPADSFGHDAACTGEVVGG